MRWKEKKARTVKIKFFQLQMWRIKMGVREVIWRIGRDSSIWICWLCWVGSLAVMVTACLFTTTAFSVVSGILKTDGMDHESAFFCHGFALVSTLVIVSFYIIFCNVTIHYYLFFFFLFCCFYSIYLVTEMIVITSPVLVWCSSLGKSQNKSNISFYVKICYSSIVYSNRIVDNCLSKQFVLIMS